MEKKISSVASNPPPAAQAASASTARATPPKAEATKVAATATAPTSAAGANAAPARPAATSAPAATSQLRETPLTEAEIKHNNRMQSGLQALGGAAEIVAGVGFTLLTGSVGGALGGGAAVLDGSMRLTHALKDMINGE